MSTNTGMYTELIFHLTSILQNKELYRKLLRCQPTDAQKLLDSIQHLLDLPDLDTHCRMNLSVAAQRISNRFGLYPACYDLKDIEQLCEHPVDAGGFADIYKGLFRGQVVCLKTMRVYRGFQTEQILKIISKEAILWRQLSHPNILTLFGIFLFRARISIVTPWMDNGDIVIYLKNHPAAPRRHLASDVGTGLLYLHINGIIHGDLKGPNILVDDTGRARLADFGISAISGSHILAWTSQSTGASKGGSVRWQAPELFDVEDVDENDEEVEEAVKNTIASDIYALGCVLFEIFTGEIPFMSIKRDSTVMFRVKAGSRPARPQRSSSSWTEWGLTEEIWACMEDCWKGQPSERPTTSTIAQRLNAQITEDTRESLDMGISPVEFRRRMSDQLQVVTIAELDQLLGITTLQKTQTHDNVNELSALAPRVPSPGPSNLAGYLTKLSDTSALPLSGPGQSAFPDSLKSAPSTSHLPDDLPQKSTNSASMEPAQSLDSASLGYLGRFDGSGVVESYAADIYRDHSFISSQGSAHASPAVDGASTFTSPAVSSSFGDLYHFYPQKDSIDNFSIVAALPRNFDDLVQPHVLDEMLNHYRERVVKAQYLFADSQIRNSIYEVVLSNKPSSSGARLLTSVYWQRFQNPHALAFDCQETQDRLRELQSLLNQPNFSFGDAMAALLVVSCYLSDGGCGDWERWINVSCAYVDSIFSKYASPSEALLRCSSKNVFIIKTSIWFDVLVSVTTMQAPHFLKAIRSLFDPTNPRIEELGSEDDGDSIISMLPMGCRSEVVWALAETSVLDQWKIRQQRAGRLAFPLLVRKAAEIEDFLQRPTVCPELRADIQGCRLLSSEVFRASVRLYLRTVVSGDNPSVPEIQESVQDAIDCIQRLNFYPCDSEVNGQTMSRSVVRNTVFGLFICGAFSERPEHRQVIQDLLDREGDEPGNCGSIRVLLHQMWQQRDLSRRTAQLTRPVDWRDVLMQAKILLV